jgi:hypothetical protein
MIDLTTTQNGFIMNEQEYIIIDEIEILSSTQAHIPTDVGIIFIDTSVSVNGVSYIDDINLLCNSLKNV